MADKQKYELEFLSKSSIPILYNRLSTASGLAEWFADDVSINKDVLTFIWNDNEQQAKVINKKVNKSIRYQWLDEPEDTFFEFRIEKDDITSDIALIVTDFADDDEIEDAKHLWNSQVGNLMRLLGS